MKTEKWKVKAAKEPLPLCLFAFMPRCLVAFMPLCLPPNNMTYINR